MTVPTDLGPRICMTDAVKAIIDMQKATTTKNTDAWYALNRALHILRKLPAVRMANDAIRKENDAPEKPTHWEEKWTQMVAENQELAAQLLESHRRCEAMTVDRDRWEANALSFSNQVDELTAAPGEGESDGALVQKNR